jgi:lipoate-protein ligase A
MSLPGASFWRVFSSGRGPAAENMAWDEALLLAAGDTGPLLRLYSWSEPAATFGYFQKFAEVAAMTLLRPLIRRPTGGGLVPHDADWTYSLVFPPAYPWYELKAVQSYQRVHQWVRAAFRALRADVELSAGLPKNLLGQCFVGAEAFDVVHEGRKVAGAAQRRTRQGLLIQGSIQPPPGLARADYERAFLEEATRQWAVDWRVFEPGPELRGRVESLRAEKYSQPAYNERR